MKMLIAGVIFWMFPLLAYGGENDNPDLTSRNSTFEAFVNYHYSGFGLHLTKAMAGTGFGAGVRFFESHGGRYGVGLRFSKFSHQTTFDYPQPISVFPQLVNGPNAISSDGIGWTIAGDLYYRYPWQYFQPYAFIGFGGIYKRHTYHFQSGPDVQKRILAPAIDVGAGFRVAVASRLWVAPEARLLFSFPKMNDQFALYEVGIGFIGIISK